MVKTIAIIISAFAVLIIIVYPIMRSLYEIFRLAFPLRKLIPRKNDNDKEKARKASETRRILSRKVGSTSCCWEDDNVRNKKSDRRRKQS